jgi:AcrR family transcriptional regulator
LSSGTSSGTSGAPARADAKRNREKLIAAARAAFTASGDPVALEAIAVQAGVGIGTLYRNFPTREALVEAVYAAELEDVVAGAADLLSQLPPDAALRAWMERYAAFWVTKHAMLGSVRAGFAPGRIATPTRDRVMAAITPILTRGAEEGSLRAGIHAEDVAMLMLGVFLATAASHADASDRPEQVARLLDLVVDALRA